MDGRIVVRAFRDRGGEKGMSELVRLTGVTKVYQGGITGALNGVSVTFEKGEFTAIMGPSGSGKSTMLNLVAGVDRPTKGTVVVGGTDLGTLGEAGLARFRRDHVGFVFQFFYLLPNLTALENVLIPAQLKGKLSPSPLVGEGRGGGSANARARELLNRLGITEVANRYPARLSGGQQQRVAIARALINNPTLLLADEPTGALDTRSGEQVMQLLSELHRDGQTILLVTHDPKLATRHAARVVSVVDGQIVDDAHLDSQEVAPSDVIRVRGEEASR
jgi:putative ABC transport system ATP-binding protein